MSNIFPRRCGLYDVMMNYELLAPLRRKGCVMAGAAQPSACKIAVAYTYIHSFTLLTNLPEGVPTLPDKIRSAGFLPGGFRTKSEAPDSFPEVSGRNPKRRIPSRRFPDEIRSVGFFPGGFRTKSEAPDSFPEVSRRNPKRRILSRRFPDKIRSVGFFPGRFRTKSEASDSFPHPRRRQPVSNCYVSSRAGRCPAQLPGRKLKPAVNQVLSLQDMVTAARTKRL
ncbi:MAG: hypothetical protein LBN98_01355 [Prevotellaceae bacterium]|nr:hypothetical protein [Prevotellaceae bacterium]